jgi:hypothetical protein
MIEAPVLYDFYLNDRLYRRGDRFVQPEGYAIAYVFRLWVMGWIGDFDFALLPEDLQAKAADAAWVQAERARLECGQCG